MNMPKDALQCGHSVQLSSGCHTTGFAGPEDDEEEEGMGGTAGALPVWEDAGACASALFAEVAWLEDASDRGVAVVDGVSAAARSAA